MKKLVIICVIVLCITVFFGTWLVMSQREQTRPAQLREETEQEREPEEDEEKPDEAEVPDELPSRTEEIIVELPMELTYSDEEEAQQPQESAEPEEPEEIRSEMTQKPEEMPQQTPEQEEAQQEQPTSPQTTAAATLQQAADTAAESGGTWDIRIEPLFSEEQAVTCSAGTPMVSASLIKLFVMATIYDRVEQGIVQHDEIVTPVTHMITVSDNASTNQLITLLGGGDPQAGMAAVNDYAASIGCGDSSLQRLMLDNNGLQNYTTAADCATLLRMIWEGRCVSAQWSEEMMQILKKQTVCNRIPAGLPAGTVCANKTGDLSGLSCGDVGIVVTDTGAYILCAICNYPTNDGNAAAAIAQLSRQVYGIMMQNT